MGLLIGFLLLSIIFSFACSVWEAVLLSITPSYIKLKENEDPAVGKLISDLKKDIDKPLSAILTLNTIAHTVGSVGVGAQATQLYGEGTLNILGLEIGWVGIITALMTLAILFLSEIIPKTIGANKWRSLAPFTARSLNILLFILKPFVLVSNLLTGLLKKDKSKSVFSKHDFAAMAEVVNESGEITKGDVELIRNVLQYDVLTAEDVMTPRPVMIMAEESMTLQDFYDTHKNLVFSRIPLYKESKDQADGLLLKNDLLEGLLDGKGSQPLSSIRREAPVVKEDMTLRNVFEILNDKRGHLAIVADEYGSITGLVTLEDVIETLFGLEIMDETDSVSDLQSFARKKWEERAKKLGLIE